MRRFRKYVRRRTFRRKFRTTRVQRSRRIFRRFIRRTATRPELKFAIRDFTSNNIGPNLSFTNNITPVTISQGSTVATRNGQKVKLIKVDTTISLKNNSSTVLLNAPQQQSAYIRLVLWTPRVSYEAAGGYMQSIGYMTQIDYNVCTVYRDKLVLLSPPYMSEAVGNDISGAPYAIEKVLRMSIKFPRKVNFMAGNSNLNPDKDMLYISVYTSMHDAICSSTSKTYFMDA